MSLVRHASPPLAPSMARVATEIAARHADGVDRDAWFPTETVEALRAERLLSVLVPRALGGEGCSVGEVADLTRILAAACGSSAVVFATHQAQVECLVRHGRTAALQSFLGEVADEQLLLTSAVAEAGVGDDLGASVCALARAAGRYQLEKDDARGALRAARRRGARVLPPLSRQPDRRAGARALPAAGTGARAARQRRRHRVARRVGVPASTSRPRAPTT